MTSRREFIHLSATAGGVLALGALAPGALARAGAGSVSAVGRADSSLRILILGGTRFLGVHQVEYALARGHTVTLFNRGRTNPELFPDVEKLVGDRDDDLAALEGGEWDVVIDNSASIPRWVRQSAQLLKDSAQQYIFTSSISAFADFTTAGMDETAPVGTLEDPTIEEITGETYGPLKALCEQEAETAFPGRATIVRPGLIVGPWDNSDRFTYWPVRIDRGGEVMAPGDGTDPVQIVDGRDLGAWMIRLAEEGRTGVYNATGPASPMTMSEMLDGIRVVTNEDATFTWVSAEFLEAHEVQPWMQMTAWVPATGEFAGLAQVNCEKAIAAGLAFRPLADTARDTLAWWKTLPAERREEPRAGCPPELEVEVLAAWHAREG
ncbi:MAG: NAD-dependent epimerase/dehydratase family protein [Gemmatimonadales bacterium]|jgi:2'-hydroxyisoflavone reductase